MVWFQQFLAPRYANVREQVGLLNSQLANNPDPVSTMRNADHIFVLENEQLREQGKHEELVETGGIYAALWNVQTGFRARTLTTNRQDATVAQPVVADESS
ncbi:MAG: hypothetical protein DCC55_28305 [Chloroflexi bacterium]|nr:MAG: hypothetical protein DCC55_28305 [Chloroflexota bacterium]